METRNMLVVKQGRDAKFRGYIIVYDFRNFDTDGLMPVFVTASLLAAVKKAELYCTENFVECNYRIRL